MTWKILACLIVAGLACAPGPAAAGDPLQSLRGKAAVNEPEPSSPVYAVREGQRYERNFCSSRR